MQYLGLPGYVYICAKSQKRIWNLPLVKSPWQWQSLPHALLWKDAFGSIIISINYGRVLCEDWAWLPRLQVQNYPHDLLLHDRSLRRGVGAVRRESQACSSSLRIIVWPLLFMSAAAFSSWENYRTGWEASSTYLPAGALRMDTWFYFLCIFILILKERKSTLLQGTKT